MRLETGRTCWIGTRLLSLIEWGMICCSFMTRVCVHYGEQCIVGYMCYGGCMCILSFGQRGLKSLRPAIEIMYCQISMENGEWHSP
jgi:hypothetical protein